MILLGGTDHGKTCVFPVRALQAFRRGGCHQKYAKGYAVAPYHILYFFVMVGEGGTHYYM